MRFPAATLSTALCFILAGAAHAQQWTALGPAPISNVQYTGRVSALACHPTDASRLWAAGADGGVWRTDDAGISWTPVTDAMPTTSIGALALDPTNPEVVYAGTGEANFANHSRYGLGLYKSLDGGGTWAHLAESTFAGRCFSRIVIDPAAPQTLYAGITPAGGFPTLAAAKGHPRAADPVGVYRSTDGGHTWAHLAGGLPALAATDLAVDPASPQTLYAAIGHIFGSPDNGVYKSTDGGETWTRLGGGLPTTLVGRISVAVAPSNPARLYALICRPADAAGNGASTRNAYRSDDAGTSWVPINPGDFQATYGWYLSFVSVQPTNPDVVFLGGLQLRRSINAGASWSTVTPPHVDLHAAAWDAAGRLIVGDDGGVHRSTNLGSAWAPLNAGLGLIQFYAGVSISTANADTLIGGTQDNGTSLRTGPTPGSWTHVVGGDGGWTQISRFNPQLMFAESQGTGNLVRSVNGGASFQSAAAGIDGADRNCFLPPYLFDPVTPGRLLYATHRVYESTSHGTSWLPVSGDVTGGSGAIRSIVIAASDPAVTYVATNNGRVLVSTDSARTFTLIAEGIPGWPRVMRQMAVHPTAPGTMYLALSAFGSDRLRRTTDFGQTWEPVGLSLPDIPVNTVALDGSRTPAVIYAGADDGVYRSLDDGATWARFGCGMPRGAVIDLVLDGPRSRLIAATQGRGAWSIPLLSPADWNADGAATSSDISAFLTAWLASLSGGTLEADFDADGAVTSTDISAFLTAWLGAVSGGC